jgi:uncharacterized BrkB/YihY/UPF0761 family membrane protein
MKHIGYFTFGLSLVAISVSLSVLFYIVTAPLAERWVDFLFAHFDSSAAYFGPLLCTPVLIWPMLVACYYLGRAVLKEKP